MVEAFVAVAARPPALTLAGVEVEGVIEAFVAVAARPPALALAGVEVEGVVEAFVVVAARPVAGGTCVFSSFCEQET